LLQAADTHPIAPLRLQEYTTKVPGLIDILPSARQRVFLARGATLGLVAEGTSGASLATFELDPGIAWMNLAPREDYLIVARTDNTFEAVPMNLGFPGVTSGALFGKLTYEGLPSSAYTYQSTGGTDEYEPKISLIPLIIGTIKGTIWALLPSIPLAVAGALYCARFLRGRARETIKPLVELLAGIPSVILGFVGGLYLAPALQDRLLALFLIPLALAGATMAMGWLWARLPLRRRQSMHEGTAVFGLVPVYLILGGLMLWASPSIELGLFDTSFSRWAADFFGIPYEQKNAVVVGLAMGFAVTPLIFTLAEDAYRNVPQTLADASLALGATPWQTARRVISPPARPGVVAAIMLGLGRAVGETMIVLMATGGTAITEWNPLQGFRALSANLATELPEAAKGESLYRTLFLSSLLLFALTFVINTLAEVVRVRGRKDL
ncbi:MAG: ABC transporter permease subunit, partial [Planctomycetes bacterium]|nr:ABC transporter permease subunit [Planctomycetota bacterium]